jgi:predicted nucleic acid-binding protein
MIVISDTTPLNYLILIDRAVVLKQLYEIVILPYAVLNEMLAPGTPEIVRQWILDKPDWIEVREVSLTTDVDIEQIEAGEREAILLAEYLSADLVLLDDLRARQVAKTRGLSVVGTLGILADASRRGLIDIHDTIAALRETNFRVSDKLIESLLDPATWDSEAS